VAPAAGGRPGAGDLDTSTAAAFVAAVAPLFEAAPGFLWRLAAARGAGFGSPDALFERARELAHAMPEPLQLELVDSHPRLGAPPATVSALSHREQGYDRKVAAGGGYPEAAAIAAELDRLNREYEGRFGFRYCVFVAGRARSALIPEMTVALGRERDPELHRAIDAVVDIAADRQRRTA
jgi:2-oxo-4-hydroxy-4-carboxy-5-ureidoimidazoline decarboxylase